MTASPRPTTPACVTLADVFQHPALEDPTNRGSFDERAALRSRAADACGECPLVTQCLFDAVVRFDVSGFVAGTTEAERRRIRLGLGVRVDSENFDTMAGVSGGGRPVDREEVLRLRQANPGETLEQLAMRLGCATSTVKRHLRQVRRGHHTQQTRTPHPSVRQVVEVANSVLGKRPALAA